MAGTSARKPPPRTRSEQKKERSRGWNRRTIGMGVFFGLFLLSPYLLLMVFTVRPGDSIRRSSSEKVGILETAEQHPLNPEQDGEKSSLRIPRLIPKQLEPTSAKIDPKQPTSQCSYQKLSDLTDAELHPKQGDRHMVTPPQGGKLTLVCCHTTAGPLDIVVHDVWAPLGAKRFLEMVTSGYMSAGVPMMRCVKNFLCQFGLSGDPNHKKDFKESLPDDPNWLPEGPAHRENDQGVKRFAQGYLAYAGAGPKTRSRQLIVSLKANGPLAGGSPWEVPWGELVHPESFETLQKFYTGYGENGPSQGKLQNQGMTDEMKAEFPKLSYLESCKVLDEQDLGSR